MSSRPPLLTPNSAQREFYDAGHPWDKERQKEAAVQLELPSADAAVESSPKESPDSPDLSATAKAKKKQAMAAAAVHATPAECKGGVRRRAATGKGPQVKLL